MNAIKTEESTLKEKKNNEVVDEKRPALPSSSPPPLSKLKHHAEQTHHVHLFTCNICHKKDDNNIKHLTIQGLTFHRECIKCSTCEKVVKNAEQFSRNKLPK